MTTEGTRDSSLFSTLAEPYRQELRLHCYRLLGSLEDAEDLVQETMLRAWQHFDTLRGHAQIRTWLYTIATHACLDALKKRSPRTLPTASHPAMNPLALVAPALEASIWLDPLPDPWLMETAENPEAIYSRSESVSLAFLTALQLLPPLQRAILVLADVLDWQANEIARLLTTTVSAVTSALHRARTKLAKHYASDRRETMQEGGTNSATSELLRRYLQAWETDDIAGLVALLKEDATMSMPPFPAWLCGREAIHIFLAATTFRSEAPHQWRLSATVANAQPAFIVYRIDEPAATAHAFGIQVITTTTVAATHQIAAVTTFLVPALVPFFGFSLTVSLS
jgi:RNA polymerase sigma-70 factor, ECF subfamily